MGLERVPEEDDQVDATLGDRGADLLVAAEWTAQKAVTGSSSSSARSAPVVPVA